MAQVDAERFIDAWHRYLGDALRPLVARIKKLEEDAKASAAGEQIERRVTRHGEHLARLQTRITQLEHALKRHGLEEER